MGADPIKEMGSDPISRKYRIGALRPVENSLCPRLMQLIENTKSFGGELERIGYKGDLPCEPREWDSFFELHIEQGPILELEEKTIGVVTGGQGIRWYTLTITGKESHAGTTPINRRKDALLAASEVICKLRDIADAIEQETLCADN